MMVREFIFGVPAGQITQGSAGAIADHETNIREQTWTAILVEGPTPPGEFKFPWWLVGIGAAAAIAIRTHSIMKKEKGS